MKSLLILATLICGIGLQTLFGPISQCGVNGTEQRVRYELEELHRCIQVYFERHEEAPGSWASLEESSSSSEVGGSWIDPWGNPYFVQVSFSGTQVRVGTLGCDDEVGGKEQDSDLSIDFELGASNFVFRNSGAEHEV
jgi:hypothetical protein